MRSLDCGVGKPDFLILVRLRHAAEEVRTHDSAETNRPDESIWCKLI
jgi:hypothetical protein